MLTSSVSVGRGAVALGASDGGGAAGAGRQPRKAHPLGGWLEPGLEARPSQNNSVIQVVHHRDSGEGAEPLPGLPGAAVQ